MKKILIMSVDFLDFTNESDVLDFLSYFNNLDCKILFYSRDTERLKPYNNLKDKFKNVYFRTRSFTKELVSKRDSSEFVIIGTKNQDFQMAVNQKILLVTPLWYSALEDKASKYGIPASSLIQLKTFIDTVYNQNCWYSSYEIDDSTYLFSLSDARSKYCSKSKEEKKIIELFHNILKDGKVSNYETYFYHFLSSMSNNSSLFNDINIWGIFPSSSGDLNNNEMFKFKEKVRYFMNGRVPYKNPDFIKYPNILIRHTPTSQSHFDKESDRLTYGATKHFKSICLNPAYKNKLKDKNVCIFDDYLTHGNSFECARNLLKSAGVSKIIFVTLGTFKKDYQLQNYNLSGDIFSHNYTFSLLDKPTVSSTLFTINDTAKDEVENLHYIFNL